MLLQAPIVPTMLHASVAASASALHAAWRAAAFPLACLRLFGIDPAMLCDRSVYLRTAGAFCGFSVWG